MTRGVGTVTLRSHYVLELRMPGEADAQPIGKPASHPAVTFYERETGV